MCEGKRERRKGGEGEWWRERKNVREKEGKRERCVCMCV